MVVSALCAVAAFYSEADYEAILWGLTVAVWAGVAQEELLLLLYINGDDDAAD